MLAEQATGGVMWRHEDPVTGSLGRSYADGTYEATAEVDAGGVNVGVDDPAGGGGRPYVPDLETPTFDGGAADHLCILDGLTTDCAMVMTMLASGVGKVEPAGGAGSSGGGNVAGLVRVERWADCTRAGVDAVCARDESYYVSVAGAGGPVSAALECLLRSAL